jgi:hypothetical protein
MQVGCTDNCRLTKEQCPYFTQDIDYQKALNIIKAEVAREIFMDIDRVVEKYSMGDIEYPAFLNIIAELKKKYTEDSNNDRT